MTPRETGTDQGRMAAPRTVVAPARPPALVRTGAQLRWWRSALGVGAALLGIRYVVWQASITPGSAPAIVFTACEVLALVIFLATLATLFARGARRPPGPAAGTLDVFVTVCGEPLDVVEAAIRTALAIDYPHRTVVLNDGRRAGKAGWEDIDRLCAFLGVEVLTRTTGAPNKAGNLNHALAQSSADFVATIDGDHRADRDFGARLMRWFDDPEVAFVSAGQRFETDLDVLNNRQAFFFDWIQPAKDAVGCAISCGSGVIYRRAALDEIGGFSEWNVVEDLHTSYRLHAAGWTSVYERGPVTTGLAPKTAAEYAHQRARWALDTMRLLFFDNPVRRRRVPARVRLSYLHTTTAYLLAIPMTLFLVGAPLYISLRIHLTGGASTADYLSHAVPYLAALFAFFASMVGIRGALATFRSTVFDSWITVIAIGRALTGVRNGGVTVKVRQRRASWLLVPQILATIGLVAALGIAVLDERSGASGIAVAWATINAFALAGPLAAVSEHRATTRRTTLFTQVAVGALGLGALVMTIGSGVESPASAPAADPRAATPEVFVAPEPTAPPATAAGRAPAPIPVPVTAPPTTTPVPRQLTKLAVPASGAYTGVAAEGIQTTPGGVDAWSQAHGGASPAIVSWYQHWGSGENRFRADWVRAVADQGAVPMVTWEPWAKPEGEYADPDQDEFRLELIVSGEFDPFIRSWARGAADHRGPILLRLMHEFNGEWYPWSIGVQEQTPELYVAAWRHIHAIFDEEGATNVSWVWSMVPGWADPRPAYPGDDVVDWVASTLLNTGWAEFGGWFDYATLGPPVYEQLVGYGKPVMLSEVATAREGGDPAAWLAGMFETVQTEQPLVRAIVLFDMRYDESTDFRLTPDAATTLADRSAGGWFGPPVAVVPG